jgi:hypothetical protein
MCSASAFFVTQTLRGLARDGRTVIASVHQPSSEVFLLFDCLYLLSGGRTVYFGKASEACEVKALVSLLSTTDRCMWLASERAVWSLSVACTVLRAGWLPVPADAQPVGPFPPVHKLGFRQGEGHSQRVDEGEGESDFTTSLLSFFFGCCSLYT